MRKVASLFPGVGFGAAYKVLQRVYKFGGQVSYVVVYQLTRLAHNIEPPFLSP
jgi:hypothetical protein